MVPAVPGPSFFEDMISEEEEQSSLIVTLVSLNCIWQRFFVRTVAKGLFSLGVDCRPGVKTK